MSDIEYSIKIRVHKESLEANMAKRIEEFKKKMLSDDVKYQSADIYRDCIEPLVPKKIGNLRDNVEYVKYSGTYAIKYTSNYAKAQYKGYNGRGVIRKWTTPGTIDHWNLHMSRADKGAYYDLVKEMIMEKLKNGQK